MKSQASPALLQEKARRVYRQLQKLHPDATIELNYSTPLELLIATILSAQCTDKRVNQVTEVLFKKFKRPQDYLSRPVSELESVIQSAGFFRQKAKSIRGAVERILSCHGGEVPRHMEDLVQLPGVGRKTANVVLGNAFDVPGLPVDTHVLRLSNRLGLVDSNDPVTVEAELCKYLPAKDWTQFSHTLIFHGRRVCFARNPACEKCVVTNDCPYFATHKQPQRSVQKEERERRARSR